MLPLLLSSEVCALLGKVHVVLCPRGATSGVHGSPGFTTGMPGSPQLMHMVLLVSRTGAHCSSWFKNRCTCSQLFYTTVQGFPWCYVPVHDPRGSSSLHMVPQGAIYLKMVPVVPYPCSWFLRVPSSCTWFSVVPYPCAWFLRVPPHSFQ